MTEIQKIVGAGGCEFIAAASAKTDKLYISIVINTDAVISVLEVNNVNVLTAKGFNGVTISAGVFIPSETGTCITAITLTSGTAIGYINR